MRPAMGYAAPGSISQQTPRWSVVVIGSPHLQAASWGAPGLSNLGVASSCLGLAIVLAHWGRA
jgi:hypothetical protein